MKKERVRSLQLADDLRADSERFYSIFFNCLFEKSLILRWKIAPLLTKKGRARSPQLADDLIADSRRFCSTFTNCLLKTILTLRWKKASSLIKKKIVCSL